MTPTQRDELSGILADLDELRALVAQVNAAVSLLRLKVKALLGDAPSPPADGIH